MQTRRPPARLLGVVPVLYMFVFSKSWNLIFPVTHLFSKSSSPMTVTLPWAVCRWPAPSDSLRKHQTFETFSRVHPGLDVFLSFRETPQHHGRVPTVPLHDAPPRKLWATAAAQVLPQLPGGSRVVTPPTSLALSDRPAHQHSQASSFVHTDVCLFMDRVKQLVTATHGAVTEAKTHPAIGAFWSFPA